MNRHYHRITLGRLAYRMDLHHQDLVHRLKVIASILQPPQRPTLGTTITQIVGKGSRTMATLPAVSMLEVEKVLISTAPLLANGDLDPNVVVTWSSSDPSQIGVEPVGPPQNLTCWALTPLESGSSTITISATGYESDTLPISYAPGVPRRLNTSVGTPEPE